MPLVSGNVLRLTVSGASDGQILNNVWFVRMGFVSDPGITAVNVAEAWWNHVKAAYRGIATTGWAQAYINVAVEQVNVAAGEYGNYPIPLAEQAGTRSPGASPGSVNTNTFTGVGMRLNVGTRLTRPGQKRFWGLSENDLTGNGLEAGVVTAANVLGAILDDNIVLGAPAALSELRHVIRQTGPDEAVMPVQNITSASVSTRVRSQVSRRTPAF